MAIKSRQKQLKEESIVAKYYKITYQEDKQNGVITDKIRYNISFLQLISAKHRRILLCSELLIIKISVRIKEF